MRLLKLVPDDTNIHFLRWRNVAIIVSLLLMAGSIALVAVRGLNLGIDFAGGQSVQVTFPNGVPPIDQVRTKLRSIGLGDPTIQQFGTSKVISVRTPVPGGGEAAANAAGARLVAGIQREFPQAQTGSVSTVSPKVSGELFRTGALSLGLAMLAISIYIWFRFEWQFGVGALFSLAHDITLTFGFFALTQLEFDLSVIAALLTIVGYSLNDTIVVYDRIRENLRKFRRMGIVELLDLSVNETLSRTVMTSLTMIMALAVLLLIGPPVIFGFTAAMLLGIFIGTYSSIYMAAPLLVWAKVGPHSFVADEGKRTGPQAGAVV